MTHSKVLIIEDDSTLVVALKYKLDKESISVDVAKNGYEGLKLLQEKKYNIVILDVMMPVMGGDVVLTKLRSEGKNKETPVYLLTALPKQSIEQKFSKDTYQGVLAKDSVGPAEILDLIKKYSN